MDSRYHEMVLASAGDREQRGSKEVPNAYVGGVDE
ncbi:hypothetical protein Y013_25595 (plasmid) [Rhodococcus pyridinivorans SB3094]|uniref:Uncharacterized protein n=1 Tax=Rhodococcus pyridinivorans SB3094 TaxID=1435356 RepID=V9XQN5_9NOCA|nr:hypothetical protein Y013_25595 [Rhodococcus pyridinivorans SB3094]